MTILYALLALLVAHLVTTITSLYDLTIQLFIGLPTFFPGVCGKILCPTIELIRLTNTFDFFTVGPT